MNKNDFIKLINIIVDKKIKEILPSMVEQEVKNYMQSGIEPDENDFDVDAKSLLKYAANTNPVIRDNTQKRQSQAESKKWSKNPVIDKILNETANNFTPLKSDPSDTMSSTNYQQLMESEYSNMESEFTFNTKNMNTSILRPEQSGKYSPAVLKQQVLSVPGATPEIVNAMVKDYSGLLKKIDKTAKQKRNGGIPRMGNGVGEDW